MENHFLILIESLIKAARQDNEHMIDLVLASSRKHFNEHNLTEVDFVLIHEVARRLREDM